MNLSRRRCVHVLPATAGASRFAVGNGMTLHFRSSLGDDLAENLIAVDGVQ